MAGTGVRRVLLSGRRYHAPRLLAVVVTAALGGRSAKLDKLADAETRRSSTTENPSRTRVPTSTVTSSKVSIVSR